MHICFQTRSLPWGFIYKFRPRLGSSMYSEQRVCFRLRPFPLHRRSGSASLWAPLQTAAIDRSTPPKPRPSRHPTKPNEKRRIWRHAWRPTCERHGAAMKSGRAAASGLKQPPGICLKCSCRHVWVRVLGYAPRPRAFWSDLGAVFCPRISRAGARG